MGTYPQMLPLQEAEKILGILRNTDIVEDTAFFQVYQIWHSKPISDNYHWSVPDRKWPYDLNNANQHVFLSNHWDQYYNHRWAFSDADFSPSPCHNMSRKQVADMVASHISDLKEEIASEIEQQLQTEAQQYFSS